MMFGRILKNFRILGEKRKTNLRSVILSFVAITLLPATAFSAEIDWRKVSKLKGKGLLEYVASLGLKDQDAINFWKNIPISRANQQVNRIFRDEAFAIYMNKYPRPFGRGAQFKAGSGVDVTGPISKQKLRLPFTDVAPLPEGPIGDPNKQYKIAYTIHGLSHPWLLNNADSAQRFADHQDRALDLACFFEQAMDKIKPLLGSVGGEVPCNLRSHFA